MILKETILSLFNERGTLLKWLKKVEALITENTLLKPINNPQSTEIVAVDNTGAQVMLEVGAGLTVDNGVLKFADVYDGTVVIEKAESVLGLRRLKENYESITTVEEGLTDEDFQELASNYGVTIEPVNVDGLTVNGFVLFNMFDIEGVFPCCLFISSDGTLTPSTTNYNIFTTYIPTFNVLSTANSTVDEWLLANTEGVSV